MVQIHSPRPFFSSRFNVLHRVCCCCSRLGIGYKPEQIVMFLRQIEVEIANGPHETQGANTTESYTYDPV